MPAVMVSRYAGMQLVSRYATDKAEVAAAGQLCMTTAAAGQPYQELLGRQSAPGHRSPQSLRPQPYTAMFGCRPGFSHMLLQFARESARVNDGLGGKAAAACSAAAHAASADTLMGRTALPAVGPAGPAGGTVAMPTAATAVSLSYAAATAATSPVAVPDGVLRGGAAANGEAPPAALDVVSVAGTCMISSIPLSKAH